MRYVRGGAVAVSLISLAAVGSIAGSSPILYLNRQYGFQLEIPSQWTVYDHTSPELAPLLHTPGNPSGQADEHSLSAPAAIFSEFPLNASVPFNTNITVSFYEGVLEHQSLEEALQVMASTILKDVPLQQITRLNQPGQTTTWMIGDCRYDQRTDQRTVPIKARLAIAKDPNASRYVLVTMSSLEDDFERYGDVLLASLRSFRWLDKDR
jgi:hypothetical protein